MTALTHEFEGHIQATMESGGTQITALKQGYLLKKSSGMRREWGKRFFVLDSLGMLYYYSGKVRRHLGLLQPKSLFSIANAMLPVSDLHAITLELLQQRN